MPGIEVVGAVDDGSDSEFEAAAARTSDGRFIRVLVPRSQSALERLKAQRDAMAVFTPGVRDRLPFEVPRLLGDAPLQRTAVMVFERLGGTPMHLDDVSPAHGGIASNIGAALAALHELPTSIVVDNGLPHRSVGQVRESLLSVFDRAASTGRVPAALLERWEQALDDNALWQFTPKVVHGDLGAQAFHREGSAIVAISGWHALGMGDPAKDLAWLLGSEHFASVDEAFLAYSSARDADRQLRRRAMLHAELEIAKWLLHGVDSGDESIAADGEAMLRGLDARVDDDASTSITAERFQTMDLTGVQELLDRRGTSAAPATSDPDRGSAPAQVSASHDGDTTEIVFDQPIPDADASAVQNGADEATDQAHDSEATPNR